MPAPSSPAAIRPYSLHMRADVSAQRDGRPVPGPAKLDVEATYWLDQKQPGRMIFDVPLGFLATGARGGVETLAFQQQGTTVTVEDATNQHVTLSGTMQAAAGSAFVASTKGLRIADAVPRLRSEDGRLTASHSAYRDDDVRVGSVRLPAGWEVATPGGATIAAKRLNYEDRPTYWFDDLGERESFSTPLTIEARYTGRAGEQRIEGNGHVLRTEVVAPVRRSLDEARSTVADLMIYGSLFASGAVDRLLHRS